MQDSLYLWSRIDGDLILLIFLPALLFGDAMSMNVHQFLRAFWQCLLLAGPGVICSALLTALMMLEASPYRFPFSLAMTQGAILASISAQINFFSARLAQAFVHRHRRTPLPSWAFSSPRARARFSRYRSRARVYLTMEQAWVGAEIITR